jgi:hypothetical protein
MLRRFDHNEIKARLDGAPARNSAQLVLLAFGYKTRFLAIGSKH